MEPMARPRSWDVNKIARVVLKSAGKDFYNGRLEIRNRAGTP